MDANVNRSHSGTSLFSASSNTRSLNLSQDSSRFIKIFCCVFIFSSKSLYDVISIVLVKCKIILLFMLSYRKLTSGIAIFPMFTVQTICVKLFSELQ